jgi:hypothetical protein
MVAVTALHHYYSGMLLDEAVLILILVLVFVFLLITLRTILQPHRLLYGRPGFAAGSSGNVALIWSDIELCTRTRGRTGLVPRQAWNTGAAVWRCGSLRESYRCSNDRTDQKNGRKCNDLIHALPPLDARPILWKFLGFGRSSLELHD